MRRAASAWLCIVWLCHAESVADRIQALLKQGDVARARQELAPAIDARPADPLLWNLRGIVEAQAGEYRAAETSFLKALAGASQSASILANLAKLYQGNLDQDPQALGKAIETYRSLAAVNPSSADAAYQLSFLLMRREDCRESLEWHAKLPRPFQQRPRALAVAVVCHAALRTGRERELAKALGGADGLQERDVLEVLPALAAGKRDDLTAHLLESLRSRGLEGPAGLSELASLYERAGRYAEARRMLERAAQAVGSATPALLVALARNAYHLKDYEGALGYLAHARGLEPSNAGVHFFFGMTAAAMALPMEAKKSLEQAVSLNPQNPYYRYAYGAVLAEDRDASQSIPHFEAYCRLRPGDVRGRFALAVAQFLSGRLEEAETSLRKLVAHGETAAGARYFLARLAKQQNRLEDAERELTASLALLPDQPDARAELGQVHTRLRKFDLAELELQEAIRQEPDHYLANVNLLALYQRTRDHPRAAEQQKRLEAIQHQRGEKERALWRTIEVRPF